ncbi:DUF819 family protein [Pseudohalioglobus sediminis]|uniref:DUF819 family protein n=1 Tax=Pseudohalioglobus sediminis TaxID=2606449 RepID=A0A5B0X706_9GAMM|nr:DUF819 family protein [Pseudohalioglobus sediminis]KAA1194131.1 DUF819 family protein [Pseudohalioglobus sediminis]
MSSLIAADNHPLVLAVLLSILALGVWMETRPRLAQFGILSIILLSALLGALQVLPRQSELYTLASHYLLPLSIPMLLFRADLVQIWRESGRLLIAFMAAALATVIGALIALSVVTPGKDGGVWLGIMTAGFIGGSANTAAVAAAMGKASDPFMGVMVAAAYTVGLSYLAFLLLLPGIRPLWRLLNPPQQRDASANVPLRRPESQVSAFSLAAALALSAMIVALGEWLYVLSGQGAVKYLVITVLSVAFASLLPRQAQKLHGHYELGQVMIYLFFAVLGAQVDFALAFGPEGRDVVLFCALLLASHFVLLALFGRLMRLSGSEVLIASNACILGPPSAAAMAVSRGWHHLTTPGILCGLLGYAIANIVGIALAKFVG